MYSIYSVNGVYSGNLKSTTSLVWNMRIRKNRVRIELITEAKYIVLVLKRCTTE